MDDGPKRDNNILSVKQEIWLIAAKVQIKKE
jgi:hypothetical protein